MDQQLTQEQLQQVYNWVDQVPLTRPKRNMARDFSDAVLFAQIIQHYYPKMIQAHNYNATGAIPQKISNWNTLNRKVLIKLKLALKNQQIESISNAIPGMIQKLILRLKKSIQKGQIPSPSTVSKTVKGNTSLSFATNLQNKPKQYHKMKYNQIKKQKDVNQLVSTKDQQIELLKQQVALLILKSSKLQQMLKGKDREIEEIVYMIKSNKK